jgi:two-component system cell cycle response regulator
MPRTAAGSILSSVRQDPAARRRVALAAGVGIGWLAFYAGWLAVQPWGERALWVFSDTAYLVPLAAAACFSVYAWIRVPRELRPFWALLTCGNLAWLAADTAWCLHDLFVGPVPYPWWSDLGYLVSDAFMLAAVYAAFRPRLRAVAAPRILDGLVAVGSLALFWWWLLIHPTGVAATLESIVTLAYPVFGIGAIGLLVVTRLLPSRTGTFAMRLVAVGVLSSVLANALYIHSSLTGGYVSGAWIELGWQAQGILFSIAGYVAAHSVGGGRSWMRFRERREVGTASILTCAIAISLVAVAIDGTNGALSVGLIAGVAVISALVVARVWIDLVSGRDEAALVDGRTGVYTADYFRDQIDRLVGRGRHFGDPFAVALATIDEGRGRDDELDAAVAKRLVEALREVDVLASTGDGHFAVAFPNVEAEEALALAERLRRAVAAEPLELPGKRVARTVSVGVAASEAGDDARSLVDRADEGLAAALRLGGNQVRAGAEHVPLFGDHRLDAERMELVASLARLVDDREGPDAGHSRAVASLASALALELDLDGKTVSRTYVAGLLHDLGKLALPDALLQKPGPLDAEEWVGMRRHAELGADLVARMAAVRDSAPIVAAHHERWDGAGYPNRLAGRQIPVEARILAVADAFVAMTSDRPYRAARSETSALTTIWRESGQRYDPAVVGALLALARDGRLKVEEAEEPPAPLAPVPQPTTAR